MSLVKVYVTLPTFVMGAEEGLMLPSTLMIIVPGVALTGGIPEVAINAKAKARVNQTQTIFPAFNLLSPF
jgi:hypothetical protein